MIHEHILVIDLDGTAHLEETSVAPNDDARMFVSADCLKVENALDAFMLHIAHTVSELVNFEEPKPGRYRCSVGDDGNFEIGSRL